MLQIPVIRTEEENPTFNNNNNNNGRMEGRMEGQIEERSEERTEKLEMLLYKLRRARWIHKRTSKYYEPKNIMLIALSFCVSSAISILSIWNTGSTNSKTNYYIGSTITVVGFLNGLMTLMANQLDYKTKINNNNLAAKAYDRLITHVCFEINFPSAVSCQEFVGEVEEKILKIKNELEVITEDRFEKELNKLISDSDSFDIITSEAGYEPKKSLFNFKFLKKNKHSSNNSSNNSVNGNNPIDNNNLLADPEYKNNKIQKPTKAKKRPSDGFTTSTPSRSSTDNIRQQQEHQQKIQQQQREQRQQQHQREQERHQRQQEEQQKQEFRQPRQSYSAESYQLQPYSNSNLNYNTNQNNSFHSFKPRITETNLSKITEDSHSLSSITSAPRNTNNINAHNINTHNINAINATHNKEEQTKPNNFLNINNKSSSVESLVLLQNGKSSPTLKLELELENQTQMSEILPEFLDFNEKQKQDLINEKQKKNFEEQENMIKRRENMIRDLENEKNSRLQELNDLEHRRIEYLNMMKEPLMNFSLPIRPQQIIPNTLPISPPPFESFQRRQQSTTTRPLNLSIPQSSLQTNQVSTPSPLTPSLSSSQQLFTSSPSPPKSVLPLSIYNMRKL